MNIEAITKLADALEAHTLDLGFNMMHWKITSGDPKDLSGHNCGTTACIGGWACKLLANNDDPTFELAQDLLGLTEDQATWLFIGMFSPKWMPDITLAEAVSALRHMAELGPAFPSDPTHILEIPNDQA